MITESRNYTVALKSPREPDSEKALKYLEVIIMERAINNKQINNRAFSLVIFLGLAVMYLGFNGCVATRFWVSDRLDVLSGRVSNNSERISNLEKRQQETDAKIEYLRLVSMLVLSIDEGVNYSVGSSSLYDSARNEIDSFLNNLSDDSYTEIVVAGHTESTGTETYNYELGKRRAEAVAGYLVSHRGIDPTMIRTVSNGESAPIAENVSSARRSRNRRVEIRAYEQQITHTKQEVSIRKRKS